MRAQHPQVDSPDDLDRCMLIGSAAFSCTGTRKNLPCATSACSKALESVEDLSSPWREQVSCVRHPYPDLDGYAPPLPEIADWLPPCQSTLEAIAAACGRSDALP